MQTVDWQSPSTAPKIEGAPWWIVKSGTSVVMLAKRGEVTVDGIRPDGVRDDIPTGEWGFWCDDVEDQDAFDNAPTASFVGDEEVTWCAPVEFPMPPPASAG